MNKYLQSINFLYIFTIIIASCIILLYFLKGKKIFNFLKKSSFEDDDFTLKNEILYNTNIDNYNTMEEYYQKGIYKATYKIIVLGDVHGDWEATIKALKKGRVIDDTLNWCGGKAHVVQMGDILDRKIRGNCLKDEDSEFKIIDLFLKLMRQAYESGGGFHCIIGNHELMNVTGNFSYVSEMGLKHFENGEEGRKKYFETGGPMCQLFSKYWNPVIKIGKYLFCHGSVSVSIGTKYNIIQINDLMRRMLMNELNSGEERDVYDLFFDDNAILWNRDKADALRSLLPAKPLCHIEDRDKHAIEIANIGIDVILLNKPYNVKLNHSKIHIANDWDKVKAIITKLTTRREKCKQ